MTAGGLLLAPNVAWAGDVTILSCQLDGTTWDVVACDSTDVAACDGTPESPHAAGDPCVDALDALIDNEAYTSGKRTRFSANGDGDEISYTLSKGDD